MSWQLLFPLLWGELVNTNFLKSDSDYTEWKCGPYLNLRVYSKRIKTNQQHLFLWAIYSLHTKQTSTTSKKLCNESPSPEHLWFLTELLLLQKPPIFFSIHPYRTSTFTTKEAELHHISSANRIFQMSNKDWEQLELQKRIASLPAAINRSNAGKRQLPHLKEKLQGLNTIA